MKEVGRQAQEAIHRYCLLNSRLQQMGFWFISGAQGHLHQERHVSVTRQAE